MSMFETMMADMLKKALPPEVMALMSPENIQKAVESVNAFLADQRAFQENTKNDLLDIYAKLNLISERLGNDGNSNNGRKPARKSAPGNGDNAPGSDG